METKLGDYFKKLDRKPEGCASRAVTLADNRPEWLHDAIREAHVSDLPNDWIYEECQAACDAIDAGDLKDDDAIHEYADGRVDIYTRARFDWAAQFCLSDTYADAESEDNDCGGDDSDVAERFGRIQYFAIARIARILLDASLAQTDDEESTEEAVSP
jgi:hypothetical protein